MVESIEEVFFSKQVVVVLATADLLDKLVA
jgi:hypothetical protein